MSAKTYGLEWLDGQFKLGIYASEADKFDGKALEYHSFATESDAALACRLLKSELADAQETIETLKSNCKMFHEALILNQQAIEQIKQRAERPSEDPFDAPADILAIIESLHAPAEEAKAKALQTHAIKVGDKVRIKAMPYPNAAHEMYALVHSIEGDRYKLSDPSGKLIGNRLWERNDFVAYAEPEFKVGQLVVKPNGFIGEIKEIDEPLNNTWVYRVTVDTGTMAFLAKELKLHSPAPEAGHLTLSPEEIDWFAKHYVDHDEFHLMPEEGYVDWLDNKAVRFFTSLTKGALYELREAYNTPANHAAIAKRRDELKGE